MEWCCSPLLLQFIDECLTAQVGPCDGSRLTAGLWQCSKQELCSASLLPQNFPHSLPTILLPQRPTAFFDDEWRCPVRVRDIIRVVQTLIARQGELQHR